MRLWGRSDEARRDANGLLPFHRNDPRGCAADIWIKRTRASRTVLCFATLRLFRAVLSPCRYVRLASIAKRLTAKKKRE